MESKRKKASKPKTLTAELVEALAGLIAASGHMSPFGSEASVKNVRLAGRYMAAIDRANAVLKKAA